MVLFGASEGGCRVLRNVRCWSGVPPTHCNLLVLEGAVNEETGRVWVRGRAG